MQDLPNDSANVSEDTQAEIIGPDAPAEEPAE